MGKKDTFKESNNLIKKEDSLESFYEDIVNCTKCYLSCGRTNAIFGEGRVNSSLLIVADSPDEEEDIQGRPFVGESGKLLEKILNAISLKKSDTFLCHLVRCKSENKITDNERIICRENLIRNIKLVKPKLILCMGEFSYKNLLELKDKCYIDNVKIMSTYHPNQLLKNPELKKAAWNDIKMVAKELELKIFKKNNN